jgi:hypothetical protein
MIRYLLILSVFSPINSFGMPNPASVHCIEGYNGKLQNGICTLKNGEKCEEWKLFRGECRFTSKPKKYKKEYSFNGNVHYLENPKPLKK